MLGVNLTVDQIRNRATELLSELLQLHPLATSDSQRRDLKQARDYLKSAAETGVEDKLRLGQYWLAVVSAHVRMVQDGKRKGALRAQNRSNNGSEPA